MLLAIDRWGGAPALSKIANVHTVGGIVFPGFPLATTREELQKLAGFWPDINKSRAEAHRLLNEAGAVGMSFELLNRNVMTGSPTIALPCGFTDAGTPLGFQFVGRQLEEEMLVWAGYAWQTATDWHRKHPSPPND